jgi:hypothetical protein
LKRILIAAADVRGGKLPAVHPDGGGDEF